MVGYAITQPDEIEEGTDGTMHWRPVRHHFGILGFGVSAWTGRAAGDRVIQEHDEPHEELYLVHQGRAVFDVDGERQDAPAGTVVFVRPDVKRTAFAEEPGTTIIAMGGMRDTVRARRLGDLDAAAPAVRRRRLRARDRDRPRRDRGQPAVSRADVQPRLLREPARAHPRRARASAPGDHVLRPDALVREGRFRP
jgi:mannose-6-phosphate isomerase-like protein (cupin superfamily)